MIKTNQAVETVDSRNKIQAARANRDNLFRFLKQVFPIDDWGTAGVYYCSSKNVTLAMAGDEISLYFSHDLAPDFYKPPTQEQVRTVCKFLGLMKKRFAFCSNAKEGSFFSDELMTEMQVKGKEITFAF